MSKPFVMDTEAYPQRRHSRRRVIVIVLLTLAGVFTVAWLLGVPADLGFSSWRRPTGKWRPPNKLPKIAPRPGKSKTGAITPAADIDGTFDPEMTYGKGTRLTDLALSKVLKDASPIFGDYVEVQSDTSTWMSKYADDTKLVHMNIPGTHDSATWNYSDATQNSLKHFTDILYDKLSPASYYRCQQSSMVDSLNAGIRAFDLRYAQDVTKSTLVFWHGSGLLSETATVEDVMFGFYHWLKQHPTEAVFLSFQYEPSAEMSNTDNADVQMQLYNILSSSSAKKYIQQTHDELGTLGDARGKIVLLRRFDLNKLSSDYERSVPGVHFSPQKWTVNGANIELAFNKDLGEGGTAYIEDYYSPKTQPNSSATDNIQSKFEATESHLRKAATSHQDSLFWTFASSTKTKNDPPLTPRIQALGNGSSTPDGGVNEQLLSVLNGLKGKRLGVVMFDFFEEPEELLPLFLGLLPPA